MGDETRLKYVVVGRIATPTDAQHARAAKNGGWKERIICGVPVLWNSCVSPPFGGDKYDLATAQPNFMTPKVGGVERYSLDPHHGATAYSGSGFDDGSRQHRFGSDAVRYAIAIQQHRDAGDYAMADQAKASRRVGIRSSKPRTPQRSSICRLSTGTLSGFPRNSRNENSMNTRCRSSKG